LLFSATLKEDVMDQLKRKLALGLEHPLLIKITANRSRWNVVMHGLIFAEGQSFRGRKYG
jgi:hypothetical protein